MSRDFMRNEARYDAISKYLERTYQLATTTPRLADIYKLADKAAAAAMEQVTITNASGEGGSQGAELTCEGALLLKVCEDLLLKWDPSQAARRKAPVVATFQNTVFGT